MQAARAKERTIRRYGKNDVELSNVKLSMHYGNSTVIFSASTINF